MVTKNRVSLLIKNALIYKLPSGGGVFGERTQCELNPNPFPDIESYQIWQASLNLDHHLDESFATRLTAHFTDWVQLYFTGHNGFHLR